jgi:RNA polymerase sigma factor (TIGR02999 family)
MNNDLNSIDPDQSSEATGESGRAESFIRRYYDELKKLAGAMLAKQSPDQSMQATALVHEAYLRVAGQNPQQKWDNRGHFFSAAAEAMRRIQIDRARYRKRQKRGGGLKRADVDIDLLSQESLASDVLLVSEALELLAVDDPAGAELVRLRTFDGLTITEAAERMGISARTADRYWTYARAWLSDKIKKA